MTVFTYRNLKLYFRDRTGVFFSLLSVLIIVGLYAVFLGNVWLSDSMKSITGAEDLMYDWLIAGLLTVTTVTTSMGAFSVMIDDKVRKIDYDFRSSPVRSGSLTGGYLCSALVIGITMSVVTLAVYELFMAVTGRKLLAPDTLGNVFLLILLSSLANTSIVGFIITFIRTQSAFGTVSTILGTLIGFLTGIYLPVGNLPEAVRILVRLFPVTHAAVLLRQVIMEDSMNQVFQSAPAAVRHDFSEYMGITVTVADHTFTWWNSILILLGCTLLFFLLSTLRMRHSKNR